MKKGIAIGLCFVLAIASLLFYVVSSGGWQNGLAAQESEIYKIQNDIELKKLTNVEKTQTVVKSATGLNMERVAKDNEIVDEFLSMVMSWDSYNKYESIRKTCETEYGISPDSNFMQVFMPEVVLAVSADGKAYNLIDDGDATHPGGINVKYESFEPYVTSISADVYSYFSFVEWSTRDGAGHENTSVVIFMYDVNGDGEIQNVDASTVNF